MDITRIEDQLHCEVLHMKSTPSTNDYCKLAAPGRQTPLLVIADEQTSGKGRLGKSFFSPADSGLYMSYLFYPDMVAQDGYLLTITAAVAVVHALQKLYNVQAQIKWVNDIYLGGKKLCGILSECGLNADNHLAYAVVGIGINLKQTSFPSELQTIVTSLEAETGFAGFERIDLAVSIWNTFFNLLQNYTPLEIMSFYRQSSLLIGRMVTVLQANSSFDATVQWIDDTGSLWVIDKNGKNYCLNSGEVSLKML